MAYLINRNPPARFQCLHALCELISEKFGIHVDFRMSQIKFDEHSINIHAYCDHLIENKDLGIKYCRYKENPLNSAGCSLTNGISDDSTKSKEVSNTVNSLHALGFLKRVDNKICLTQSGYNFASTPFDSIEMADIIKQSVLSYGLFVGFMYQLYAMGRSEFDSTEISVGYPRAQESVFYNEEYVTISSGSRDDSNTRTRSCILAWATTAGYIYPKSLFASFDKEKPHISSSEYILESRRNINKYIIIEIPDFLFDGKFITKKPLDYKNLTKNIGALREHNQENIRELSLQMEPKIQNRRFAVLFLLNKAFHQNKSLSVSSLIEYLLNFEDYFIISHENLEDTIFEEINIANVSGIPFSVSNSNQLNPQTGLDLEELSLNAPESLISILDKFEL